MKCFVVSPIGEENSPTRIHSDNVYECLIAKACEPDFEIIRSDKILKTSAINDDIFKLLNESDLVIADITELNPNVFFELGYRFKTKRPYIIIRDKASNDKYPFDISHIRIMDYSLLPKDLDSSINELKEYINNCDFSGKVITDLGNNFVIETDPTLGMVLK